MKWTLTEDQAALAALILENRTRMISAEEFAVTITEAGFRRAPAEADREPATPPESKGESE